MKTGNRRRRLLNRKQKARALRMRPSTWKRLLLSGVWNIEIACYRLPQLNTWVVA